jgi:DNA (cytosine-5)-methyltransferase 1
MRIGSLFSGIGGLELGLEWAGVGRTVWQCEKDPFARSVLARHWPDVPRFGDVTDPDVEWPAADVICGGFPCQDISLAGKGAGLDGEKSGLFFELARVVRDVGPRFLVLENVPAITTRGLDRVLGELAGMGFDAEWHRVSAAEVGAHHLRNRWFLIGWRTVADADYQPDATLRGQCENASREGAERRHVGSRGAGDAQRHEPDGSAGQDSAQADAGRDASDRAVERSRPGRWLPEPEVGRVAYGLSSRVDKPTPRLRALGNAVVPQAAELVGRRLLEIAARVGGV